MHWTSVLLGNPGKQSRPSWGLRKLAIYPLDLLTRLRAASRGVNSLALLSGLELCMLPLPDRSPQVESTGVAPSCPGWADRRVEGTCCWGGVAWKHLLCMHPPLWRNLCLSANSQGRAPDWSLSSQWAGWYWVTWWPSLPSSKAGWSGSGKASWPAPSASAGSGSWVGLRAKTPHTQPPHSGSSLCLCFPLRLRLIS